MHLICEGKFIFYSSETHVHVGKYAFSKKTCRLDWLKAFTGQLKGTPRNKIQIKAEWLKPLKHNCGNNLYSRYCEPYIALGNQLGLDNNLVQKHGYKTTVISSIVTNALQF